MAQTEQRFASVQGRALIFSSGWENIHYVGAVTSGVRIALPAFFGTRSWTHEDVVPPTVEDVCALWSKM